MLDHKKTRLGSSKAAPRTQFKYGIGDEVRYYKEHHVGHTEHVGVITELVTNAEAKPYECLAFDKMVFYANEEDLTLIRKAEPVEEQVVNNPYLEYDCETRAEYFEFLADTYGVELDEVEAIADLLGESEDFDGLVSMLLDM